MKGKEFTYENLKKLEYIDCVQKETTRFFGPINFLFSRICFRDCYLDGVSIKKGTIMNVQPIGTHYSERYFKEPK